MRKCISAAAAVSLLLLTGCSAADSVSDNNNFRENVQINKKIIDEIRERGYLSAGCKTNVPGLSFYDSETKEWSGLETEIAYRTAAEIFGVSEEEAEQNNLVHFSGVTVADREEVLESGEIDCLLATYTITDERKKRYELSESYYTSYIGLMVRDYAEDDNTIGSPEIKSIEGLDGKYIGVPRNATTRNDFISYLNMMDTLTVTPVFCEYESYDILYEALKNGNIDVIAVDVSILNGYDDDSTKILDDRFAAQHYGAAVLPENKLLIDIINKVTE